MLPRPPAADDGSRGWYGAPMGERTFISLWDRAYSSGDYRQHWEPPETPAELAGVAAAGLVPARALVLDLGCGAGAEAVWLARRGHRVVGVDSSAPALEIARRRADEAGVKVDFRRASVFDLPLEDGAAGFALDRGCFHAIDPDDRALYAAEVTRVLAPGASLLLRGAAETDEAAGLFAVDAEAVDRWFPSPLYRRGPLVPFALRSQAGDLPAHLALITRAA